jgi:Arc/MetJ-type ribon-helix-helix transcriptional regulator
MGLQTLKLELSEQLRIFVEQQVNQGGYGNAQEYIYALLEEVQKQMSTQAQDLEIGDAEMQEQGRQKVAEKRLSEFRGILPATRPYPGKSGIRKMVAASLAQKSIES